MNKYAEPNARTGDIPGFEKIITFVFEAVKDSTIPKNTDEPIPEVCRYGEIEDLPEVHLASRVEAEGIPWANVLATLDVLAHVFSDIHEYVDGKVVDAASSKKGT